MGILLLFQIFVFFILISKSQLIIFLNPIKGIVNIKYNSEENKLSFKIPLESSSDIPYIKLELSEPKKSNRENCYSNCNIASNIMNCDILKSDCELLQNNSIITIISIVEPSSYAFNNYDLLTSEIEFKTNEIEMTCANFKLSFFLYSYELSKHPYNNMNFTFPIYYRDKEEKAICILPKNGKYIPCVIDATKILFKTNYTIFFGIKNPIKLTDDLNITISDLKKYKLEDNCGKEIDSSIGINIFNNNAILKIFLLLYFLF